MWLVVEAAVFLNPLVTSYGLKRTLLRLFGGGIGHGVLVKPGVHIKYPWRLVVGDHTWIGERAWLDTVENIDLGSNVCISQGAYLCTGNHDWSSAGMDLTARPIQVDDGAWIGAFAQVGPGVRIGCRAVVTLGSVLLDNASADGIYQGNPATEVGRRRLVADSALPAASGRKA